MEYQITQGEIITKWLEIIQQADIDSEKITAGVRLARWVERRLAEANEPDPAMSEYEKERIRHLREWKANHPE